MAPEISRQARRFAPDLVLAIGGFHVPLAVLRALRGRSGGPPVVGWVGDAFGQEAAPLAALYDLVAHTDSGLEARHRELGFASPAIWLPHAANPHRAVPRLERSDRMVFVAAASPERERIVRAIAEPIAVFGPGWKSNPPAQHAFGDRVAHRRLAGLYAGHLASLNARNADHVVAGLNQRNFDPYLFGAPAVTDDQPDLAHCFDPGSEALVYRTTDELNDIYARLRADRAWAATIAARGRSRILADHTFAVRLSAIRDKLC